MNWKLWARQIDAIARLELKRFLLARRWVGVYIVTVAPVILLFARSQMMQARFDQLTALTQVYATVFQFFELRFACFMSCAVVFSQLFRGDVLEKTSHFYLLAPARREVIAVGKYVAGVIFVAALFTSSTAATHLLMYSANPNFASFYLEGAGSSHLLRYVAVTIMAIIGYGAIFVVVGLVFKNPGLPTLFLLAWESLNFAFPPLLQMFSVVHYLQALLPVTINRGPFAIVTEPPAPIFGIPILMLAAAMLLGVSGWLVRSMQVTYSAD
jgi:hypothetical protein